MLSNRCGWQVFFSAWYYVNNLCPSYLVFHGGSGSTKEEIQTAVNNGVVKMNVDTGLCHHTNINLRVMTPP